jgi:excisionase family DNA binding protein
MKTETLESQYLTKQDAADYLKVSKRTIDNLMASGSLPFIKLGRIVRFPKSAIDRHIKDTLTVYPKGGL